MGYSVGHWEGDTLVIVTTGYNDRTWLVGGLPHTESLRTTERFHRKDFGHLEIAETFDDPKAFTRPWTVQAPGSLMPDSDLLEHVCNESESDSAHLVGKASDLKSIAVEVAPEILARYVGVCAETAPRGGPLRLEIFLSGTELLFSRNGRAKEPLTPLSNTKFLRSATGAQFEFVEENGEIAALQVHNNAGDARYPRVRERK